MICVIVDDNILKLRLESYKLILPLLMISRIILLKKGVLMLFKKNDQYAL